MIRTLRYFYIFSYFALIVPFSYAQNVSPFEMTDEEFNNYLATLPPFNQQEWQEIVENAHQVAVRQGFPDMFDNLQPVPKRKSNRHPIAKTCDRQP